MSPSACNKELSATTDMKTIDPDNINKPSMFAISERKQMVKSDINLNLLRWRY